MPAFKSGKGNSPEWCELEYFEIVKLSQGAAHAFERLCKEKLIVGRGQCRIAFDGQTVDAEEGANLDLVSQDGRYEITEALSDVTLIRMCGRWGDETGGSGIFGGKTSESPHDDGDAVTYAKSTDFDNHYHDCDEYWIIFEGRALAVSEGRTYEIGPGDCVATGMGQHHDLPQVIEPLRGVWFETTLEGQGRRGHLWDHTHGPAEPKPDRI